MEMITCQAPAVNSPTTSQRVDALLSLQASLNSAGFYPVYNGHGFDCVNLSTGVRFKVELNKPATLQADETPELDDALAPAVEDALYASWSDGQLRDTAFQCWVEQYDRALCSGQIEPPVTEQSAPLPDDEFDCFWTTGPGSLPQEDPDRDYAIEVTDEDLEDVHAA